MVQPFNSGITRQAIGRRCKIAPNNDPARLAVYLVELCCKQSRFEGARFASNRDPTKFIYFPVNAIRYMLLGVGSLLDAISHDAATHLMTAANHIGADDWARTELKKLAYGPCSADRMLFRNAIKLVMARADAGQT